MRVTKQEKISETHCDNCGNTIESRNQEIGVNAYLGVEWESDRQLCSVPCMVRYFVANPDELDADYHYHLSLPNGESLRELVSCAAAGIAR